MPKKKNLQKKSSKKLPVKKKDFRIAFTVTIYDKKKTNQKKWIKSKTNKDGSLTRYGVTRKGHRFKEKIYSFKKSESKKFKKVFEKAKKAHKFNKNTVTSKTQYYTGKFDKKTKFISGEKSKAVIENISYKRKFKKGKKVFINVVDFTELLDLLDDILEEGTS